MKAKSEIEDIISNCLDVDSYDVQDMARWARKPDNPPWFLERVQKFRIQLQHALDTPGTITAADFKSWTRMDLDSQAEVQQHLQEIWDVCFGTRDNSKD